MAYRIEIEPSAYKELNRLPENIKVNVMRKIRALSEDSRPHGAKKLVGYQNGWRIRIGDYRVLYAIFDDVLRVLVIKVGHRRNVYL
ncbi:MAG: type II toxin-antitoxin system RelE/ParE family toxin [Candidatus Sumerlaeota bacterium]|nr:type II toxin-antitoxin system RelE/ParE family toxin [Candidatus Sumerlaeota bacterium]